MEPSRKQVLRGEVNQLERLPNHEQDPQLSSRLAGQAVAAALGYATLRYLGEQHLRDCVRVAHEAGLALPAPAAENHSLS